MPAKLRNRHGLPSSSSPKEQSSDTSDDQEMLDTSDNNIPRISPTPRKGLYPSLLATDSSQVNQQSKASSPKLSETDVVHSSKITEEKKSHNQRELNKISKSKPQESKQAKNSHYILYTVFFVLAILSTFFYYLFSKTLDSGRLSDAEQVVKDLQRNFKNQPRISLKIIEKSLSKVINPDCEPKSPSILLLVSSKGAETTRDRFADLLAELVYRDKNFPLIEGQSFEDQDPDKAKMIIDDRIEDSVSENGLNVLLIRNIDKIPGEAAILFYKYCDHDTAPYKRMVIIMTVSGQKEIPREADSRMMDSVAHDRLNQSWATLGTDQFEPLFTRVSVSVSGILPEPNH